MHEQERFDFYTERRLVSLTGLKASNLEQLLARLRDVPGSVVFYHTHHMYLAHHFERPLFTNDFALWVSEALREEELAEKLAVIDLLSYLSIRDLREAFVAEIEKYLNRGGHAIRECPRGDEFYFCRSKSFVMPTGLVAHTPDEFFTVLPEVSNVSLFFHFFESRLRLGRPENDFSAWLAWRGDVERAERIHRLDPYSMTLDELRTRIAAMGKEAA